MKKNFSLSGMRDFTSFEMTKREYLLSLLKSHFKNYAFLPISKVKLFKKYIYS